MVNIKTNVEKSLKVHEIFYSIQGESSHAGEPCIFIRLSGCNLRCTYCDTTYAYNNGKKMALAEIISSVRSYDCDLVEITGGEPLLQAGTTDLIHSLLLEKKRVLIETNGTQDLNLLPPLTTCIMDIKCPSSGESEKMDWNNLDKLHKGDEVKFVLSDKKDYDWACRILEKHKFKKGVKVLFSPITESLKPAALAQWILEDQLHVKLQLQLHRLIWPNDSKGR